jgi:hypothetical protein
MIQAFLLGIANGHTCTISCLPTLLPYFLKENGTFFQNSRALFQFLLGRLFSYLIFTTLFFLFGASLSHTPLFGAIAFLGFSILLILPPKKCPLSFMKGKLSKIPSSFCFGLLSALSLCPSLFLLLLDTTRSSSLLFAIGGTTLFFIGTSIFFLPLSFLSIFKKKEQLLIIGTYAAYLMAAYYGITGITLFFEALA